MSWTSLVIGVSAVAIFSKFFKIATVATAVAGSLALSAPAFARGGGGGHGGGFGGGGHGGGFGGGGFHGGGFGGRGSAGAASRVEAMGLRGYGGYGGWGWGGGGWDDPCYYGNCGGYYGGPYYGDDYPVVRRVYVQPVHRVYRSCIWRRVHVHTSYGWRWRRVRYCAQ